MRFHLAKNKAERYYPFKPHLPVSYQKRIRRRKESISASRFRYFQKKNFWNRFVPVWNQFGFLLPLFFNGQCQLILVLKWYHKTLFIIIVVRWSNVIIRKVVIIAGCKVQKGYVDVITKTLKQYFSLYSQSVYGN